MFLALLESLRPKQWTKNILLFAGIIFSQSLLCWKLILNVFLAFIVFSFVSGCLYLLNDLMDIEQDQRHPVKRRRPLASGRLGKTAAFTSFFVGMPIMVLAAFLLSSGFGYLIIFYILLVLGYSLFLKNIVILDVMIIAMGFVLRAIAGAVVIDVSISSWLLVCTIFLSLFLALNKRRHEISLLGANARSHRSNLSNYSIPLIDLLISIVASGVLMSYALYTTSPTTIEKFGSRGLVITLPFVIYGVFRYLYLVHQFGAGGSPEEVLINDKGIIINVILYVLCAGCIIYL